MASNVDKLLEPVDLDIEGSDAVTVELPGEDEVDYELVTEEETGDGGVVVDFEPAIAAAENVPFDANLAEHVDDTILNKISSELVQAYKDDKLSRAPWEKAYTQGLRLLGLKIEERTQPWAGASGVFHPIMTEAVIKFQADAMTETFPAGGPVLTKIVGKADREREKQAKRVRHDMNYQCTEVMTEYRNEHEQALFHTAIAGSTFKKVYYDHTLGRQTSRFVMADDFIVAYGTTDLVTCPRSTHLLKEYPNDLLKAQIAGRYRTVDIPKPTTIYTDVERAEAKAAGDQPAAEKDDRHSLLEMHVIFDIPGFEDVDEMGVPTGVALPFIITMDLQSKTVLSIYRNWNEEDPVKKKLTYFVQYLFLPGLGFYGIGLVHLLGGIAKSATSILRQLVDAGTLANLPAGLKSRGLRIKGDNSPLRPGEFRDVDAPGGSVKDSITFLPHKEPSNVLFQLLGAIVEEGRTLASITDLKVSDTNSKAPVGTTLALLERGMKVMNGVNARLHAAMKIELKLVADLVGRFQPGEYEYDVEKGATRAQDYDGRIDVIPVSNPNASTMAHRIMQHQAVHQLSLSAPEIYDRKELHRQMIEVMGVENPEKVIPLDEDMIPRDPVAENMALITAQPVKAFIHQDHESHLKVHMSALEDPKLMQVMGQSPAAKAIMAAAAAHIQEHVAFQYRREIEKQLGVPMPDPDEPLPAEAEVMLSKLTADAADKVLQKDLAEMQAQENAKNQNDPVLQLQRQEAETKAAEVQRKGFADKLRTMLGMAQLSSKEKIAGVQAGQVAQQSQLDMLLDIQKLLTDEQRMQSQEKQAGTRIGVDIALATVDDQIERERIASQERIAGVRADTEAGRAATQANSSSEQVAGNLAMKFMDILAAKRAAVAPTKENS
jgi:hypothetical protein